MKEKKSNSNIHTKLPEEKPEFHLNENISPKPHKIENYNPNMQASLTDFNLFLKALPLNEKALSVKSFPLLLMGKTGMSSISNRIFTEREKYIN